MNEAGNFLLRGAIAEWEAMPFLHALGRRPPHTSGDAGDGDDGDDGDDAFFHIGSNRKFPAGR